MASSADGSGTPNSNAGGDVSNQGGGTTDDRPTHHNGGSNSNSRRGPRGRRHGNAGTSRQTGKYKGKCDDIADHVYDVGYAGEGKELFASTTREIAEYIARTYENAGEFRIALVKGKLEDIKPPSSLDADSGMAAIEMYKLDLKEYREKLRHREKNLGRIFPLILGQCSRTIRDRVEASSKWNGINRASDVMELLTLIRQSLYQRSTTRHPTHNLVDAYKSLYRFRQGEHMSNSEYLEKMKDLIEVVEHFGEEIGCTQSRIASFLDRSSDDNQERSEQDFTTAKLRAREEFMACLLLTQSDPKRYGNLILDVENEFTRGTDGYPNTLSKAYDMLVNYKSSNTTSSRHRPPIDTAFIQDDNHRTSGHQGRGGGGRGRGSGGRGSGHQGRGSGRGAGPRSSNNTATDDQNHLVDTDNQDNNDHYPYVPSAVTLISPVQSDGYSLKDYLVLDTGSSVDIISNPDLLTCMHRSSHPKQVRCNAGTITLNTQATLGSYPSPVWYNPHGIANILSLHNVQQHYRVTMDTAINANITVHTNTDHRPMIFRPIHNGLYVCPIDQSHQWCFFDTVQDNKAGYTPRQQRQAADARRLQHITMYPNTRQLMDQHSIILRNNPITRENILAAEHIYGTNLASLKGKTVHRSIAHATGETAGVPQSVWDAQQGSVNLAIDIFYVNNITFFVTMSRNIRFITTSHLINRQIPTLRDHLKATINIYKKRGFQIKTIFADPEFDPLRAYFPNLQTVGADDHVADIERCIRSLKDKIRSALHNLQFRKIPKAMIIRLVYNVTFWSNAFIPKGGVSTQYSPRYIITGKQLDYNKHVRAEFGEYVQTHEEHNNDMGPRTVGAICLGPTGNEHGTHWFMSLATGKVIQRTRWTPLPMPSEAAAMVEQMANDQNVQDNNAFGDRNAIEIENSLEDEAEHDDPDDESYVPTDSEELDTDDEDEDEEKSTDGLSHNEPVPDDDDYLHQGEQSDDEVSLNDTSNSGEDVEITGVGHPTSPNSQENNQITGVDRQTSEGETNVIDPQGELAETNGQDQSDETPDETVSEQFARAERSGRRAAIQGTNVDRRARRTNQSDDFVYTIDFLSEEDPQILFALLMDSDHDAMYNFLTEQMSAKKGLKVFGDKGADAIMDELRQLLYRKVMEGRRHDKLTKEDKKKALQYLMFLKQKRSGKIKGRGCADGRKQRIYKTKEETSSPTISLEALLISCVIDALEERDVATCDIPGAFMQADMDELIHIKLEGDIALLLVRLDPSYTQFLEYIGHKRVPTIYAALNKALYGTLQAALLFYNKLTSFLKDIGYQPNAYDPCVYNKMINGNQCTVGWHVDDLKISHVDSAVVDDLINKLNSEFGKEAPLTVTRGKVHDYLGMTIDYSKKGKVILTMKDYIQNIIDETDENMLKGGSITPCSNHLFEINPNATRLDETDAETFHHLVAKLLYLSKRARPDIQLAVAFLSTRVQAPDEDDWKKLGRCIRYLKGTIDIPLTIQANNMSSVNWWIDASFAVHPDYKSHTGATVSFGKGCPISLSTKQKINTRSSTEAELVGINDAIGMILWMRNFLEDQGYSVTDNVIHQDNMSTMLLAKNGRKSSGKKTRHIEIRYYFITDNINRGLASVKYCPTEDMIADFFTKPLQGSQFRKLRNIIMNYNPINDSYPGDQECVGAQGELNRGRTNPTNVHSHIEDFKVEDTPNNIPQDT